jgi:hypothetical protein
MCKLVAVTNVNNYSDIQMLQRLPDKIFSSSSTYRNVGQVCFYMDICLSYNMRSSS